MKKNKIGDRELIDLLKMGQLEKLSEDSVTKLTGLIQKQYATKTMDHSVFERYFGGFILFFLICSNLLVFINLNPFSIESMSFTGVAAFVLGVWTVIFFMKRFKRLSVP